MRKRFAQEGLEAALNDRPRPGAKPKLDEKGEAFLIALACSDPPKGRECWTMQLLAVLKKAGLNPGRKSSGV
ncbi:hypothetical protein DRP77_13215 [Candidatus Poribacteria bacterium]|nr:MAG: hypothetical protein DRP77_13215 [Candidatus Poribacteria bacterium]